MAPKAKRSKFLEMLNILLPKISLQPYFNLSSGMGGKVTSFLFDQKNETRCFFDHHYSVILTKISIYFKIFRNLGHHSKVILRKQNGNVDFLYTNAVIWTRMTKFRVF